MRGARQLLTPVCPMAYAASLRGNESRDLGLRRNGSDGSDGTSLRVGLERQCLPSGQRPGIGRHAARPRLAHGVAGRGSRIACRGSRVADAADLIGEQRQVSFHMLAARSELPQGKLQHRDIPC